jgi:hypothetical protein
VPYEQSSEIRKQINLKEEDVNRKYNNLILYVFFWVFPRRQIKICRRFRTLSHGHRQRLSEANPAPLNPTPGKYPKENIQDSEHGENLKSRVI